MSWYSQGNDIKSHVWEGMKLNVSLKHGIGQEKYNAYENKMEMLEKSKGNIPGALDINFHFGNWDFS